MNKRLLPLSGLLIILAFLASACSVDKNFSFSIEKEFVISNYNAFTYSSVDTINAKKESSDFDKYRSDMSSLDVQSASYTITYFSGPLTQNIVSGIVSIGDVNGGTSKVIANVSNVPLASIVGTSQPLTLTADGKQYMRDLLMGSSSSALLSFTATTNEKPITFTVRFHFDLSATYSKSLL